MYNSRDGIWLIAVLMILVVVVVLLGILDGALPGQEITVLVGVLGVYPLDAHSEGWDWNLDVLMGGEIVTRMNVSPDVYYTAEVGAKMTLNCKQTAILHLLDCRDAEVIP